MATSNPDRLPVGRPFFGGVFPGRKVLVTGHTGFKGAWLCEWLTSLGAEVGGFALAPTPAEPLFRLLGLESRIRHLVGDVRDLRAVEGAIAETDPDFIFHLAAQPLVRLSYEQPVDTFATNVMGTAHVLEAVRKRQRPCVVVAVTTDKCYENREWVHSYREEDPMGGHDPYSASKGAAEIVISAYRRSYFSGPDAIVKLASARAGNVIGGGDWSADRIVPDCVRALRRDERVRLRNPRATRPWQHVLEPLSGYLWLAACLSRPSLAKSPLFKPGAFNFGPGLEANRSVSALVEELLKHWTGSWEDVSRGNAPHEAQLLNLSTDKAFHLLGWSSTWNFEQAVAATVSWYRGAEDRARELTAQQIEEYVTAGQAAVMPWAQ